MRRVLCRLGGLGRSCRRGGGRVVMMVVGTQGWDVDCYCRGLMVVSLMCWCADVVVVLGPCIV